MDLHGNISPLLAEQCDLITCHRMAQHFWKVRHDFEFVAPTTSFEESMQLALDSPVSPCMVSEMGDNPTAGGAGDVTWTLRKILARPE